MIKIELTKGHLMFGITNERNFYLKTEFISQLKNGIGDFHVFQQPSLLVLE